MNISITPVASLPVVADIPMEGAVSQIFDIFPSFYLMRQNEDLVLYDLHIILTIGLHITFCSYFGETYLDIHHILK